MAVRLQQIDYGQVGKGIEQDLQRAQQSIAQGFQTAVGIQAKELQYANTVLENMESLKNEGDIAHQMAIAERVDALKEKAKSAIYTENKRGKKKFDVGNLAGIRKEIQNETRAIKNAAIRSEELRKGYQNVITQIQSDDTIADKRAAIQEATAEFHDPKNLFNLENLQSDSPYLMYDDVIRKHVNKGALAQKMAAGLIQKGSQSATYELADGKAKQFQYNPNYATVEMDDALKYVKGVSVDEDKFNALKADVKSSNSYLAGMTDEELDASLRPLVMPAEASKFKEPTVSASAASASRKESLDANAYLNAMETVSVVANKISNNERIEKSDLAKISKYNKDAFKNIEVINYDELVSERNKNENNWLKEVEALTGLNSKKKSELEGRIEMYRNADSQEEAANAVGLIMNLIKSDETLSGKAKGVFDTFNIVNSLNKYINKDSYGVLLKDKRGEGTALTFLTQASDLEDFANTIFEMPKTLQAVMPVQKESVNPEDKEVTKIKIEGFGSKVKETEVQDLSNSDRKNKVGSFTPADETLTEEEQKQQQLEEAIALGWGKGN
jgi:hypothetical protein